MYQEETHKIIGCAFEVLNTFGHGLLEKPYGNALVVEFQQQGIPCAQAIEKIRNNEKAQIINYFKITGLRVGLLLNFEHVKLEWEKIIL